MADSFQPDSFKPDSFKADTSEAPRSVARQIFEAPADILQGIGAGAISTLRGASQIAHKLVGTPEIPAEWAEPKGAGIAGQVGKFAEQAAEFALPMAGVSKLTKGAALLTRMGAEALASGAVAGVQSGGSPAATAGGVAAGAAGPALGAGAKALGESGIPRRLYQSALKPPWTQVKKVGLDMLDTGLKEQIPVSSEGLALVESKIKSIQNEISQGIQAHAAQGRTVDTSKVLGALDDLEKFYQNTAAPEGPLQTLKQVRDEFQAYHGQQIPVDQAQKIKVNTYQLLKKSYGEMASAKVEGLKQVARGLKEQISSVFPEVSALNERQSKLLDLDTALTRAAWRIENHQMMGIGSGIAAGAGGAIAGGPGAVGAFMSKLLLDDPTVKSKLAIVLSKAGVKNATGEVSTRLAALQGAMDKAASSWAEAASSRYPLEPIPAPAP